MPRMRESQYETGSASSAADTVGVYETFVSIQGESTWAGLPCFFVRLAGCNLRCSYCDTAYAYGPGIVRRVDELAQQAAAAVVPLVEITGGEPLLQPGFPGLARGLRSATGGTVLVETNGSLDISIIPEGVIAIMDVKCPGSGESARMDPRNLGRLRRSDEVKFVLTDRADYEWACALVRRHDLPAVCAAVLFSPAWGRLEPKLLAEWIAADRVAVRLQLPLHKVLGVR
jgi:7-carboxy-7-deazaguanine synthase